MNEVEKRKIALASVLKPWNDTRMYEKLGATLEETKKYEVHYIGVGAPETKTKNVHVLAPFSRISLSRILAPWKILKILFALKPALLIVTTHELLIPALIAKQVLRCNVIYDVQENYYRNIRFTEAFPLWIRPVVALYVRLKERTAAPFIDHFILAEQVYADELPFLSKRFTILENKVRKPGEIPVRPRGTSLLFSGTLAETTGTFIAIDLALKLHEADASVSLTLIGYCAQPAVLKKLKASIEPHPFIRLIGGDKLVPHEQILKQIEKASAGIISYPPNQSTQGSIPTKLYEYLGYRLPILLVHHSRWEASCSPYEAACVFDPAHVHPEEILQALRSQAFYSKLPENVYWESEKTRLLSLVSML